MNQVMWETVFNKQFEEFLENQGIDSADRSRIDSLKKHLNIVKRSSCQLMVEVDENWKENLAQVLKEHNLVHKEMSL